MKGKSIIPTVQFGNITIDVEGTAKEIVAQTKAVQDEWEAITAEIKIISGVKWKKVFGKYQYFDEQTKEWIGGQPKEIKE